LLPDAVRQSRTSLDQRNPVRRSRESRSAAPATVSRSAVIPLIIVFAVRTESEMQPRRRRLA